MMLFKHKMLLKKQGNKTVNLKGVYCETPSSRKSSYSIVYTSKKNWTEVQNQYSVLVDLYG